ncbi:adenine phosphoribosyltransferase-like [Branchiostoma lanceolatum]|uniref:adenine phosphoribosyltransferase-like n=1 Tax=Branchiostoma lanceolatum TaxID=7740 RepID=UPI003453142E
MAAENAQSKQARIIDRIKSFILTCPDFPKPGIPFKDIMPIVQNPDVFSDTIALLEEHIKETGVKVDVVAGLEARGFLFGPPLALRLECAFVPIRKAEKLPGETVKCSYALEYGQDTIEIQKTAVKPDQNVVIVDDLIATGGTMAGACTLMETVQANVVGCLTVVELDYLKGRENLKHALHSLVHY